MSALPLTGRMEQTIEEENEEEMEEFRPKWPRGALHTCGNKCGGKASSFSKLWALCQKREVQPIRQKCARRVTMLGY